MRADAGELSRRRQHRHARFTQPDPIGLAGGMNLYGYAGGDPLNLADPFGTEPCSAAQLDAGWRNVRGANGEPECESNRQQDAVVTTAEDPGALEAMWTRIVHGAALTDFGSDVVQLGMPSWVGGPGKAAARLTAAQARQLANWLGFTRIVKGAPIHSRGQQIFTNGRSYITQDIDMHQGPLATWKLFDRNWDRLGTYTYDLLQKIGK